MRVIVNFGRLEMLSWVPWKDKRTGISFPKEKLKTIEKSSYRYKSKNSKRFETKYVGR